MLVFLAEAIKRSRRRDLQLGPSLWRSEVAADSPLLISALVETNN